MKRPSLKQSVVFGLAVILVVMGAVVTHRVVIAGEGHEPKAPATEIPQTSTNVPVETVEADKLRALGSSGNSWPGEILSTGDIVIHPVREGQIAEWRVKLGAYVKKGQILGKLTAPPATIELNSALAARTESLVRARAQATATQKLVQESRTQLDALRVALDKSRDASFKVADREAEQALRSKEGASLELNASQSNREASLKAAQAELDQAKSSVPLKRQSLRVSIERLAQRSAGRLSYSGTSPSTSAGAFSMSFKWGVGVTNSAAQDGYRRALGTLLDAMKDPSTLPDSLALAYVKASQDLLASTIGGTDSLPQSELNEIRTELTDDQKDMIDALNAYKEAQSTAILKEAEIAKIAAERDRDLASAKTTSLNSELAAGGASALKEKLVADADTEYAKQKAELEAKVSELNRELAMAQAEVRAAEAGYDVIAAGVAGQDITAPQDGIVSSIFKNLGDHIAPDVAVAAISSANAKGRFVRFKIPGDIRAPETGDSVTIDRPGYALSGAKAKVTGVGLALDVAGSYTADAEFVDQNEWPVHATVRVTVEHKDDPKTFIPIAAVWFDDAGVSNIWLVTEGDKIRPQEVKVGRTVGDQVEIEDGLNVGDRYVAKPQSGMKTGQSVVGSAQKPTEENKTGTAPSTGGDGHGHSHDE